MRLWTIHPRYLDSKGLVAAWREALLAQKVLDGKTRGYRSHPQLLRFREQADPIAAIGSFLTGLLAEANARGYHFDGTKVLRGRRTKRIEETRGQLQFEWKHLRAKLRDRSPQLARQWRGIASPDPHPLFCIVPGDSRPWEKG
jgi:hypothetical protein